MIETKFDENWRSEKMPNLLFLISPSGRIIIKSEKTGCITITINVASCILHKCLEIQSNGELVFSGIVYPNQFKKIIYRTLLNKGDNTIDFFTSNVQDSPIKDDKYSYINDVVGIKDFLITLEITKRIV